ncbi:MAG: PorV/PorQ family protein [Ignavibacteriales bacterium]|nr:PorV/PorQ family protein [Ignavibacteriales bacterium]
MKKMILAVIIILAAGINFGQSKVGTTAANFLTIPVGSKATGMGGAFVAVANDATGLYWNPGSISWLERSEFNVSYSEWLVGTKFNWIGLAFKITDNDAVGISVNQLDYGEEEITTPEEPNGTGQRWKAQDISLAVTYSKNLTDRFSIGGSLKYIRQQIWNESASAFALDIGLLFHTELDGLRIGMNISNFGTEMKLDGKDLLQSVDIDPANTGNNDKITATLNTDSWTLPLIFTVGLGYDLIKMEDWKVVLATDAVYPNNQSSYLNLGTEVSCKRMIALRVGYNSLLKTDAEEGLSAGVGLMYDFGPVYAKVDYSYNQFGIFDAINRVSVSVGF